MATKPTAMGFVSLPLGLLGAWMPLLRIGLIVAGFWFGYSWVWDRGYAARDADYAAAIAAKNAELDTLNAELEAAHAVSESVRQHSERTASAWAPDRPQCVQSQCALPADVIARLNKVN